MGRRRRRTLPEPGEAVIDSLSHDGRGVAHPQGKAVFVHGALPGERVRFAYTRVQRRYDEGRVEQVLEPAPERVEPRCAHFGVCGGCSLQHQSDRAQIEGKQQVLLEALRRIGGVGPDRILPPLTGENRWGYRCKARLGVKHVPKKGRVLVGFRERGSGFVTDVRRCEVLDPRVGTIVEALGDLVGGLSIRDCVPQIEVALGDVEGVLVFRVLSPPAAEDEARLIEFGRSRGLHIYLQEGGPESLRPLSGQPAELSYALPRHDLRLVFEPLDFTQVNPEVNRKMVARALDLLEPGGDERVLDLFCGLGNFSLPAARYAAEVLGVEGDAGLVERARENARRNGLANAGFRVADLYGDLEHEPWLAQRFDKVIVDPPRSGAAQILPWVRRWGPERLVYVSCYPATLARDAGNLVREHGYRLSAAGVMDMFPHTAHVESIALFVRNPPD